MIKIKISDPYYFLLFCWSFFSTLTSVAVNGELPIIYSFNSMLWNVIRIYIVIKVLLEIRRYTLKQIVSIILLIVVGYISYINSQSNFFIQAFWFIAGAANIDWKKAVKILLKAQIIALFSIIILCMLGVLPDKSKVTVINGINTSNVGHSLGYYHPNDLAGSILQIVLMWLYVQERPYKIRNIIFCCGIAAISYIITRSSTSVAIILFVACMLSVFCLSKKENSWMRFLSDKVASILKYLIFIMAGFSILFSIRKDIGESILGDFHSRINQMSTYFFYYKIKPWGQVLINHTSAEYNWKNNLYTLDNAYIHLLLGFGYVIFIAFLLIYIVMLWKAYKEKNYIYLLILIAYVILGFTETMFIRIRYNFTIFLVAEILWNSKSKQRNKA